MLDIPSITGIVAAIGVIVGVVFAVLELRNLVRQRQTDLVIRLYSTRTSNEFQESWKKVMAKEYKDYHDYEKWYEWSDFIKVGVFFEGIGILLHRKLIDIRLVDDLFSYIIRTTWEKMKPIEENVRKHHNAPQIMNGLNILQMKCRKESKDYNKHNNRLFIRSPIYIC